jgi:hypothetical protein
MPQTSNRYIAASSSSINLSKQSVICDAYGCSKPATRQTAINVGRLGTIGLNFCERCISEFNDNDNDNNDEENRRSVSYQDTNQATQPPKDEFDYEWIRRSSK